MQGDPERIKFIIIIIIYYKIIYYFEFKSEWINIFFKEVLNPNFGLFEVAPNKISLQPSPNSYIIPEHLLYFKIIGRLVAYVLTKELEVEVIPN